MVKTSSLLKINQSKCCLSCVFNWLRGECTGFKTHPECTSLWLGDEDPDFYLLSALTWDGPWGPQTTQDSLPRGLSQCKCVLHQASKLKLSSKLAGEIYIMWCNHSSGIHHFYLFCYLETTYRSPQHSREGDYARVWMPEGRDPYLWFCLPHPLKVFMILLFFLCLLNEKITGSLIFFLIPVLI